MYQFTTIAGLQYTTEFSPKEISKLFCFDAFDIAGQSKVLSKEMVNFQSFQFINN